MPASKQTSVLQSQRWLLLIHQLPAKPAYVRVKIWRRLQGLGAVAVKNAVYALPASEQAQEDFEWLMKEIFEIGGEAIVCEARLIDGLSDDEVRALFNAARDQDYADIADEARALSSRLKETPAGEFPADLKAQFSRLKARHSQTVGMDFFDAGGRQTADGLIREAEGRIAGREPGQPKTARVAERGIGGLRGFTWVTRHGVHVDRIACAWMIRRFIDSNAAFKFVPPKGYAPAANELRFDMFEAEFTHEGDRCSFEVLLGRAGLDDPALEAIAEIVHDIDLKEEKYGREETAGIKALINGICSTARDDEERIARGSAVFNDLYTVFQRHPRRQTARKRAARPLETP